MAIASTPYGLMPISDQAGTPRTRRIPAGIASGLAANIFKFQPVKMIKDSAQTNAGTITPVTATTDQIFGVFAGVEFTPVGGRPTESPFWASGQTWDPNYDMFVYIWEADNPNQNFLIQADGTVPQTNLGGEFNLSNFTSGSTVTGFSACTANHTVVAASSQGQLSLVEFNPGVGDAIGDAFTDLIVHIAYPQLGGYQTSKG